jgi:hypothetical protein
MLLKVGFSNALDSRIDELNSTYPGEGQLVMATVPIPGAEALETFVHSLLPSRRVWLNRAGYYGPQPPGTSEWFILARYEIEHLKSCVDEVVPHFRALDHGTGVSGQPVTWPTFRWPWSRVHDRPLAQAAGSDQTLGQASSSSSYEEADMNPSARYGTATNLLEPTLRLLLEKPSSNL